MSPSSRISRRDALARVAGIGTALSGPLFSHEIGKPKQPTALRDRVARLFVISFPGTTIFRNEVVPLVAGTPIGGIILYGRNCVNAVQVNTLIESINRISKYPLIVCMDQEGGAVERLTVGVHTFPSEQWYGELGSTARVYADAATTARDLRRTGLTLNLAPVADVLGNDDSPIGSRSYGHDPRLVASLTAAAVRGYQEHGLAAMAKHFIGLGHTRVDSHESLPTVRRTLKQFEASDLIPFRAAIAARVSGILVAHVALPRIDPSHTPASLSPKIMGLIRHRLRFNGALMTDSLVMGAVSGDGVDVAAERAFAAGADVLLLGSNGALPPGVLELCIERITSAVQSGRIPQHRLDDALARAGRLRR